MSNMGTGVAAGVAQVAHQAQQVSRQRDKRVRDRQRSSQQVKDIYETHLRVLDEQDGESAPRVMVDAQMQDPPPRTAERSAEGGKSPDPGTPGTPGNAAGAGPADGENASRLDVVG